MTDIHLLIIVTIYLLHIITLLHLHLEIIQKPILYAVMVIFFKCLHEPFFSQTKSLKIVSLDQVKDANKLTTSSSNSSIKDLKEDTKPIASNTSEPYSSNRYLDWRDRDRDRERDRDRRYREDDRRRDYDRRG